MTFRNLPTSITTDNLSQSPAFPISTTNISLVNTFNEFEQRSQSMNMTSSHQENIPPVPVHPRSMTINAESMIIISIQSFIR